MLCGAGFCHAHDGCIHINGCYGLQVLNLLEVVRFDTSRLLVV
jgi:hypothetical protein